MYSAIAANKRKTVVILAVFFALVTGLALLFGNIYQDYSITSFVLIFAIFYALWGFFGSAKLALGMNGAHEIAKQDNQRLWRTVENLTITTGMVMPRIYIIDDKGLNAFATGRDPAHSAVAVTTGLLENLTDTELEGVLAHELGHIKNYDIRVSMIAFALVTVVSLLCDFFLRVSFWGGRDSDNDSKAGAVLALIGLVALILSPIVAMMLQLAISRKREYLADATGALTTRYPEGLASALEKIKKSGSSLRRQNTSTAHLFIANPLKGKSIGGLFSTHPPIEERVSILRSMETKV
ncbi:MAG: M48 family metalloprotease [Patescibacteria group bacterium]